MTQTMPNPMTYAMLAKVTDGAAVTNPTPSYPTAATSTPAYTPAIYNPDKATNHPKSTPTASNLSPPRDDPDFTFVTLVAKSMNQPY